MTTAPAQNGARAIGDSVAARREPPLTWCLLGRKAGDNTQVRALAQALGWPVQERHIEAQPWELLTHLGLRRSLTGIDLARSSPLAPPWPELILSAGRRNEPVARWIRARSGGLSRLVHIGRPWARLQHWDLIITTPQYQLPAAANVLCNTLPLHPPAELAAAALRQTASLPEDLPEELWEPAAEAASGALVAAVRHWLPRWAQLPRPWVVLLLGGDSGPFVFTAEKARRLGALARTLAASAGGTVLLSNSPRTPPAAMAACQAALGDAAFIYDVRAGLGQVAAVPAATENGPNPYPALLALADAFVVTGESMSMLAEAHARASTRRDSVPLFIFDPGDGAMPWYRLPHAWRYKPLSHRLAMRLAPARMRRDVGRIQQALIDTGTAYWLNEDSSLDQFARREGIAAASVSLRQGGRELAAADTELARSAAAVRALFGL